MSDIQEEKDSVIESLTEKYKADIKRWKAGLNTGQKLKACFIEESEEVLFFRTPTIPEFTAAEQLAVSNDTGIVAFDKKAGSLMADCYIGGDLSVEELKQDTEKYVAVSQFINSQLIAQKKTSFLVL